MALIRINAHGTTPILHGAGQGIRATLRHALATPGPVAIMTHGYRFQPGDPAHCPHLHILSLQDADCPRALSWPRRLGFDCHGVGIAFGWNARGSLQQARRAATAAAQALTNLIAILRALAPDRPVHLIGHSLGGLVALRALHGARAGDVGRVILLNAAAFQLDATRALASPAGRGAEIFNIASRENALFDFLYTHVLKCRDRPLGRGLFARNAMTIQLDDFRTLTRLSELGFAIAPPHRRACHWSTYLREGVFPFYRALIQTPERLTLQRLQTLSPAPGPDTHTASACPAR